MLPLNQKFDYKIGYWKNMRLASNADSAYSRVQRFKNLKKEKENGYVILFFWESWYV